MPTAEQIQQAIAEVHNQPSFIKNLLTDTFNWPINLGFNTDIEDITYEWTDEELRVEGLSRDVLAGPVLQMQSLEQDSEQPWGIFILEFKNPDAFTTGRGLTGPLRKVLRGLCRRKSNLPAWDRENLLFICTNNYEYFRFAYFKAPKETKTAPLITFGWEPGTPARTTYENLCYLEWPDDTTAENWVSKWTQAFDVEKVNKRFYTEIAKKFTDLVGGWRKIGSKKYEREGCIVLPTADDQKRKEFAVCLIGRLVFCWFLKKKHSEPDNISLVPENILSLNAANKNSSYYHFMLEPLFFEVLNKKLDDRHNKYKTDSWDTIPFLNGGLFTPHSDDYYTPDDFQGISPRGDVKVPDEWLRELLEIFERYNFTIEENTPLDIELSIDPEMLGRIFENLLAEINPETGETARKSTGSYYTPRPIVEYMVDQSIKQYLLAQTNVPEEKIDSLLSYADKAQDAKLTEKQIDAVIEALDKVKVLDPACGSGAFPIGILQKMLLILQKVDPDSKKWKTRLLAKIPNTAARKALAEKLESETWQYIHKLGVIQNSIYGVDIQPIAAEISKLRVFLSLIVDEAINDSKENRGIEPLPNLEFKFVCANTLIGLPETKSQKGKMRGKKVVESKGQTSMYEATDDIAELKQVIDNYFTSYGEEKERLEKKFSDIQSKLRRHMLYWGKTDTQTAKLADWNPFGHDSCQWFDTKWMFGIKDGFDIVIANPPWGIKIGEEQCVKLSLKVNKSLDSSEYFILRSELLMHPLSLLTFIIPKSMIFANNWRISRRFLLDKNIVAVADAGITFENVNLESFVFIVKNTSYSGDNNNVRISRFEPVKKYNPTKVLHELPYISQDIMRKADSITLANLCPISKSIIKRIQDNGQFLENISRDVFRGLYIPDSIKEKILDKGKHLYVNKVPDVALYTIKRVRNINLSKISKSSKGVIEKLNRDRIIVKVLRGKKLTCAFAERELLTTEKLVNLVLRDTKISPFYVLALLNSSLTSFYFAKAVFSDITETSRVMDDCYLSKAPLKKLSIEEQKPFILLVEEILAAKKANPETDTKHLEKQIDQMVYKLYGLTPEETAIVKGHSKSN